MITDVPVGAWTVTAVLDLIKLRDGPDVAFAADASLIVDLLGGLGTIASGLADWSDTARVIRLARKGSMTASDEQAYWVIPRDILDRTKSNAQHHRALLTYVVLFGGPALISDSVTARKLVPATSPPSRC